MSQGMSQMTEVMRLKLRGGWRARSVYCGVVWLACLAFSLMILGCEGGKDGRGEKHRPSVVVSIPPLASLIQPLLGEWGDVASLLPAGATVHGYEPSASQMHLAANADLLVVVGRNLDGWAQHITTQAAGKRKVRVLTFAYYIDGAKGLNQNVRDQHDGHDDHDGHDGHDHAAHADHAAPDAHAGHAHSGPNPHLWLDPVLTRQFVQNILPEIFALAPDDIARTSTRTAAELLDQKLQRLDEQYKAQLAKLERKDMVTFHNAFDLVTLRYGLRVAAHLTDVELAPGGEVNASQLIETIKTIRQLKLKVLYAEPQFPDRATQVITQETGAAILRLDPLGGRGLPDYSNYFEMMDSNLNVILQGQSIP